MSRYAGVVRDGEGLERLLDILDGAPRSAELDPATIEATNLHTVSTLVATAALDRRESRGCHRRADYPIAAGEAAA
jgi:L-aspartate oxidase